MANTELNAFLNPVLPERKEVIVSKRFLDENGQPVPFVIRPISQKESNALIRKYRKKDKKGHEYFDQTAYMSELVASAVVYPPLDNAELQKQYGLGKEACLTNMLFTGEYGLLADEIMSLSGMEEEDLNNIIEDVKNE